MAMQDSLTEEEIIQIQKIMDNHNIDWTTNEVSLIISSYEDYSELEEYEVVQKYYFQVD